jgi:hypothetical protein
MARVSDKASTDNDLDAVQRIRTGERSWLVVGTDLTPDELMMAWKGKKGNGGIRHLSFVERKPFPLGTEAKVVCDGSMGMCVFIELQKGKTTMARQKWCRDYKATTACTVRLLDKMNGIERSRRSRQHRSLDSK